MIPFAWLAIGGLVLILLAVAAVVIGVLLSGANLGPFDPTDAAHDDDH